MAQQVRVFLRGPGRIEVDGEPAPLRSKRIAALLTFLVAANRPVPRAELVALLWPDRDEKTGRANLRWALSQLRGLLPERAVDASRQSIAFVQTPEAWVDVLAVADALRAGDTRVMETALLASPGPLLDGFFLDESPEFETWLLGERARRRQEWRSGAQQAIPAAAARGDEETAHTLVRFLIDDDPLDEAAHRLLLELLAGQGEDVAAQAHYEQLVRLLDDEVGVEPAPETRALAERIRRRSRAPRHNLPHAPGPLVGREQEMARLADMLRDPAVRLVSLVGLGGMGKTRLAEAAGRSLLTHFLDGVAFISLLGLDENQRLPRIVLDTLVDAGFIPPAAARAVPLDYLQAQLRERTLLLILDNFEQLVDGAALLEPLLTHCPGVTMLVTSRQPLRLRWEHRFGLEGLSHRDAVEGPATQLFVQAARRARSDFVVSDADRPALARIGRATLGMPLALELAAQWVGLHDLDAIARRLEENLDYLAAGAVDLPPRQRSIRAVFDYTWTLLDETARRALARLTLFRAPFTMPAAEAVTGAPPATLLVLLERRLLTGAENGRFHLHELLRMYAGERLEEPAAAARRHAHYFLAQLARWEKALSRSDPEIVAEAAAQWADVRAAWAWATESGDAAVLESGLRGYIGLCAARNWTAEALADLMATSAALTEPDAALQGRLLAYAARLARSSGDARRAATLAERTMSLLSVADRPVALADALLVGAEIEIDRGELETAEALLDQCETLYREEQAPIGEANVALERARISSARGRPDDTRGHMLEALAVFETMNDRRGMARCYYHLANQDIGSGDYEEAFAQLDRAAELYEQVGDVRGRANCEVNRGLVALHLGRIPAAEASTRRAQETFHELEDAFGLTSVLINLGRIATRRGDFDAARVYFMRARRLARRVGEQGRLYLIRYFEAELARRAGALDEAAGRYAALLREVHERGMTGYVLYFLPGVGGWMIAAGAAGEARQLLRFTTRYEGADHYARWQAARALDDLPAGAPRLAPLDGVDAAVSVALRALEGYAGSGL